MKNEIIAQIKDAHKQELTFSDSVTIDDLRNNELLAGLSMETIDAVAHELHDAGEIELI